MAQNGQDQLPVRSTARGPLGPMLFALVLKKLVSSIDADDDCFRILLNAWYLDDGVLAGNRSDVVHALHLIEALGPHLGLHINIAKCDLFSRNGNSLFPSVVTLSLLPNLEILGTLCFVHDQFQRNTHF